MSPDILCVEVDSAEKLGRPPLRVNGELTGLATTGRCAVMRDAGLELMGLGEEAKASIRKAGRVLLEPNAFDHFYGKETEA